MDSKVEQTPPLPPYPTIRNKMNRLNPAIYPREALGPIDKVFSQTTQLYNRQLRARPRAWKSTSLLGGSSRSKRSSAVQSRRYNESPPPNISWERERERESAREREEAKLAGARQDGVKLMPPLISPSARAISAGAAREGEGEELGAIVQPLLHGRLVV